MLQNIIDDLLDLKKQNKKSLVVFDLDSTLFDVSKRSEKILKDYASCPLKLYKFPELTPLLNNVHIEKKDWGIENALNRLRVQGDPSLFFEDVHQFWKKSFFSNHYLYYDIPYDGAVDFVKDLEATQAHIAYLTGRDHARMGGSSEYILKEWGFPVNDQCELVLKPHLSMNDAEFKTEWFLQKNIQQYERVLFFENEPVNINHLQPRCPAVEIIYFESVHSGKEEVIFNHPRISNFHRK